jgi:hypothetical protein
MEPKAFNHELDNGITFVSSFSTMEPVLIMHVESIDRMGVSFRHAYRSSYRTAGTENMSAYDQRKQEMKIQAQESTRVKVQNSQGKNYVSNHPARAISS